LIIFLGVADKDIYGPRTEYGFPLSNICVFQFQHTIWYVFLKPCSQSHTKCIGHQWARCCANDRVSG